MSSSRGATTIVKEIARDRKACFKLALIHAEQGKDLSQEAPARRTHQAAASGAAFRRGGDRSQRAHRRHDGRRAVHARARSRRRRGSSPDARATPRSSPRCRSCAAFRRAGLARGEDPRMRRRRGRQSQDAGLHVRVGAQGSLRDRSARRNLRCTPQSIASHSLYENADPFQLIECSGTLDLTQVEYEAVSERAVKVTGSAFIPAERYTVKLEGAELAGYQSIVIGSVRDPFIIRQIDDWTARLKTRIHARVKQVYGDRLRRPRLPPGTSASTARTAPWAPLEPVKEIRSHELCLLIEVTAPTQEFASSIAGIVAPPGAAPADTRMERPHHRARLPYNASRPRRGLPLQRQPRRRARRSVRNVSDGDSVDAIGTTAPRRKSVA